MVEIFLVQFLATALGGASIAAADWAYRNARIAQRVHSFWVSASIAVICLPVLVWVCCVFLGFGLLGQTVAGILIGTLFLWVYRNLRQLPALPTPGARRAPARRSGGVVPPAPKVNR